MSDPRLLPEHQMQAAPPNEARVPPTSDPHRTPTVSAVVRRAGPWWGLLLVGLTAVGTLGLTAAGLYLRGGRVTFCPRSALRLQRGGVPTRSKAGGCVPVPRRYA